MRNALTILFVWVLLSASVQAQTLKDFVSQYNRIVNEAELHICDSNLNEANELYAKAFKLNSDKPFSRDLFTAFHCAMDVDDHKAVEQYLKILLARGMNQDFMNRAILNYYSGNKLDFIKSLVKKYPNNLNRKDWLNKEITRLGDRDQKVRFYFAQINKNGDYMTDSVYKVDAENSSRLFQIIQDLGHYPDANALRTTEDYPLTGTGAELIILHNIQDYFQNKQSLIFDTVLYKAVLNSDFPASTFATLLSYCYLREKRKYAFHYKDITINFPISIVAYTDMSDGGKPYFETLPAAEENRINEERAKLGLCTLQELRKKINFNYMQHLEKGKYFAFGNGIITNLLSTGDAIKKELNKPNPIHEYRP